MNTRDDDVEPFEQLPEFQSSDSEHVFHSSYKLAADQRRQLLEYFAEDIASLAEQTGDSYDDWLSDRARGGFSERASGASG